MLNVRSAGTGAARRMAGLITLRRQRSRRDRTLPPGDRRGPGSVRRCSATNWIAVMPMPKKHHFIRKAPTPSRSSSPFWIVNNYRASYGMFLRQRNPLQPRVADPWQGVRHPQDQLQCRQD